MLPDTNRRSTGIAAIGRRDPPISMADMTVLARCLLPETGNAYLVSPTDRIVPARPLKCAPVQLSTVRPAESTSSVLAVRSDT